MMVPQSTFENLLALHGNVSASQISQGSKSQTHIRQLLKNRAEMDPNFPRLVDGDFLSGSYARGTKIYPLDDIDIMIVIDGTGLVAYKNGLVWNASVRGSGMANNPLLRQLDWRGLLSSRTVMELFRKALQQSYPSSTVAKDGQAINVWLDSYNLGLDIVPCFHVIPADGSQQVYYIPAGLQSHGWMMTNPKIDEAISDLLHKHHNEKLKAVIKLIKLWNQIYNADRLRSYHLETIAWRVFDAYPDKISHYGTALLYFFQNATPHLQARCPDATQIGGPIDGYLSPVDRVITTQNIERTRIILTDSYLFGLANEATQVSGWRLIYGNNFGDNN